MKVEAECLDCKGEGEFTNLFGETSICKNCRGAGVVMVTRRRFVQPTREVGYVTTRVIDKPVDPDKDKIVLITFKDGKDISHWFCGTEENANEIKLQKESQGFLVEQCTPTEYYRIFQSKFKATYNYDQQC